MKKIKNWIKKSKWYIIAIVAFLALLTASYFIGRYYANKSHQAELNNYIALQDTVRNYQTKIKGLEVRVFETKRVVLSQADAIKVGLVEKEALRKLNIKTLSELTSLKMQLNIARDSVSHSGQIVYIDTNKQKPAMLLPFTFGDTTKHFVFSGGFNSVGKMNYKFDIPALKLDIYGGVDKKGVAKLSVTTDNPYIKFSEIKSTKIDVAKPSRIGLGATVGYGAFYSNKQINFGPGVIVGIQFKF